MNDLGLLFGASGPEGALVGLFFAMLRTGGALLAAPVFSALGVPLQVRTVLAAAVAVLVLGTVPLAPPADPLSLAGVSVIAQELLIGLTLGFLLQLAFAAPLLAGEYLANSIGIGFANMVDPQGGNSSPVIGQFLMILMTLIFLSLDGHLVLLEVVVRSYALMPLGDAWLGREQFWGVAKFGSFVFASGLAIALPVGFALFALNIVVGVVTRTAPQLNIFAVGLPLTLMAGFVVLAIAVPAMAQLMIAAAEGGVEAMRDFLVR
jgi:flagellar biosynthetic protein FliR